jgi:beta-glucosidase
MIPDSFIWGAATSAYQIEGGRDEDGKGKSIWDTFSDLGRTQDSGDDACDSYHRWKEDLDLLEDLGAVGYRFSVAWTRVFPDGDGDLNRKGLDYYRRMVQGMRDRGIAPYLTLYHWDLPQALQDSGGWGSRDTVDAFVRYAEVVAEALGDEVKEWITHNEPWVASMLGHKDGVFAPGVQDWPSAIAAAHHIMLSHGRSVPVIRERVTDARVGIVLDCRPVRPASRSDEDIAAATHFDGFRNRWFFDPVFGRGYPFDVLGAYESKGRVPDGLFHDSDLEEIAAPIDFLGLNYYTTVEVGVGAEEYEGSDVEPSHEPPPGYTEMGWRIDPQGLTDYLVHLYQTYDPPSILITENGASYSDGPDRSGVVDDRRRVSYLARHIAAVEKAIEAGVPVDGYFVWSLLDNLEWTHGFAQRFGLVWVDHQTFERVPKRSFHWYGDVIANGGLSLVDRDEMETPIVPSRPPTGGLDISKRLESWMDGYVTAWTSNNPDAVGALFTEDAVYDAQTSDGEIHGREQIVDWWLDIDDEPNNWDFEWIPLVESDDLAVIIGNTKYYEPEIKYRNLFVIRFDESGLCRDFTEWYIEEGA